ncbi:MAG: GNAT family N-acetyltransferase [bacterium]|nr:GNAT family N-acetyltransferase [bacterium]
MTDFVSAPARLRVVSPGELDPAAYSELQQRVFGPVLRENGLTTDRLTPAVFDWKYRPPAGDGRIAVVEVEGAMVASNAMFPVELARGDERFAGWQSCDTVTAPAARGRGYFKACLRALIADLPSGAWFFGYPNTQSSHGFAGVGCATVATIRLAFRPIVFGARRPANVESVDRFDEELDDFGGRLARVDGRLHLARTSDYFNWRYCDHPFHDYEACVVRRDGRITGVLVTQRSTPRGRPLLCIAEFLALDRESAATLARQARWRARRLGCRAIMTLSSESVPGLWRLPRRFEARPHLLMRRVIGRTPAAGEPWLVQTGDWDVF